MKFVLSVTILMLLAVACVVGSSEGDTVLCSTLTPHSFGQEAIDAMTDAEVLQEDQFNGIIRTICNIGVN